MVVTVVGATEALGRLSMTPAPPIINATAAIAATCQLFQATRAGAWDDGLFGDDCPVRVDGRSGEEYSRDSGRSPTQPSLEGTSGGKFFIRCARIAENHPEGGKQGAAAREYANWPRHKGFPSR